MEKKFLSRDKIVGKQVIDSNGMILGTVKDIAFDLPTGKMSITVADEAGKEIEIPNDDVSAVGDAVILKRPRTEVVEGPKPTPAAPAKPAAPSPAAPSARAPTGLCPNCGYQNDPNSRFCIKCGTKLR